MVNTKIVDFVDFKKVNILLEGFNQITGFVTAILDLEGNVLSKSGWRQICTEFHRINPESAKSCRVSDTVLANKMSVDGKYHFHKCSNGLIYVAVPILIDGDHVANLFSGQFLFEEPDVSFFKKQAEIYDFEESSYLKALEKVPIISQDKVKTAMDFLLNMTKVISEITSQKFEQIELNEQRKKNEEALRHSEEDLKESQRIAHVGSWRLDLASNQVVWSKELYKIYGFDPTSPPPPYTEHQKLFTPKSWDKLSTALTNTRETGIPYELELETLREDGNRGWMWVHGETVRDATGAAVELRGVAQDITGRKQTEEALRTSEEKYQSLFKNAQVALFRNRLSDGKVLEINERYAKLSGYSNIEDCMAEFNAAAAWVDPNGRKKFLKILHENGFVSDYETEIIRRDGTHIWISFSATIFPEQGFLEGSIVDITERKKSEKKQEKLQLQLNQAQKMESVGRLAGGVAHDFNNMLSIILGNAEIIMEDMDPSNPIITNLEEIYKAAERSTNLTRQLLAFARKQTIAPKILNLNHILEDMLKMLMRLIGENIDLTWNPAPNLWPVKIDPSQIDQILANLCVNARDAIKSVGKVTIETDNISFDEAYCKEHEGFNPGDYVMMAVSDNGSGMDKEILDNLFEPFFTTKVIGQGTGLGLATVYGIVKQNNGFINVYSEPGEGTTFKIYLPVHSKTAVSNQKDFKKASLKGNETILLVEDEKAILRMTKMMLERLGYTVLTASAPNEAISIMAVSNINEIHLLMTDVVMPEMNGRDLSKKLLTMYPGLKCLFMSGYTANVIAHHGVLDTGVQFISKPFSMQDLAAKVRDVLDEEK